MQDDAQLVRLSLHGDDKAFGVLFERYKLLVASVAYANLGNKQEIEDVIQETFARAWENLGKLRDVSKFSSWLYGIARWVSMEKRRERHPSTLENPDAITSKEPKPDILQALNQLPLEYREAIVLFYIEQKSYNEIAKMLDVSSATVNFRLTKARHLLRSILKS